MTAPRRTPLDDVHDGPCRVDPWATVCDHYPACPRVAWRPRDVVLVVVLAVFAGATVALLALLLSGLAQ